uniref:Uncharacterized protein n=1 Tax=Romanomermis culicivorax TaxID=13658 RepID=A0A915IR05_ROMCU
MLDVAGIELYPYPQVTKSGLVEIGLRISFDNFFIKIFHVQITKIFQPAELFFYNIQFLEVELYAWSINEECFYARLFPKKPFSDNKQRYASKA